MSLMGMDRRQFLGLFGAAAAAAAFDQPALAAERGKSFSFIFLTDTHIQPELDATHGVDLAMKQARGLKADFVIQGGDHVFDALGVPKERANSLFDLYAKTEQDLGMKVHHTIGNHDCFGVYPASGTGPSDPEYGKKMYVDRFGPAYYSFDHKGVHFIVLDSIGITADRHYEARMSDEQLAWLGKDLSAPATGTPIIVTTHIPLVTAVASYTPPAP
jgi:3',5'-cyclic AMP phosphodiesterase CpdA